MVLIHAIDDTVLAVYLIVTLSISVHRGLRRRHRPQATLMTSGPGPAPGQSPGHAPAHTSVMSVAISVVATFMSAVFALGVTAEVAEYGATWLLTSVGSIVAGPIVAFIFIPVLSRLQVGSVHEYLCLRYGDRLSPAVGSVAALLQTVVHVSVLLQAATIVTSAITGLTRTPALLISAAIGITYAAMAVPEDRLFADSIHFAVTFIGLAAVSIQGAVSVGGLKNLLNISGHQGRLDVLRFSFNPFERYNVLNVLVGSTMMWTHWFVVNPEMLQQYSSLRTVQRTRTTLLVSVSLMLGMTALCVLAALALLASWAGCWPADWPADGLLLRWAGRRLGYLPGLAGLLLAALLGGALAAGPTQLAAQAAVIWDQLASDRVRHEWRHRAVRLITVLLGIGALCLAAVTGAQGGLLQTWVAVYGAAAGPVLGLLILGMLVPFSSAQGAVTGYLFGLILALWTAVGSLFTVPDAELLSVPTNDSSCLGPTNVTSGAYRTYIQLAAAADSTANGTGYNISGGDETGAPGPTDYIGHRSPLDSWYSLSFLLISLLATVVTVLVGIGTSLLPGCRRTSHLRQDTISPLVTRFVSKSKMASYTDQGLLNRPQETAIAANIEMNNMETPAIQQVYEDPNPPAGPSEVGAVQEIYEDPNPPAIAAEIDDGQQAYETPNPPVGHLERHETDETIATSSV
ncbi:sodium-coupled monocarboxylate transporter 1-like [Amphibalanus amphitrite]|uniref:sodium-coupled monocarboxylate transporter 1-like n=1 Tax=Amphibalanus amphitrite TaxID=1232801 RepID=UPI001C91BDE4|nr:sodium-coupled monocarboxylate transporter 1-like [Amphibalanus amphitrite]